VKKSLVILLLLLSMHCRSQEIGYLTGVSRLGINPTRFQPLYGFSIGGKINKYIALETALFYSQRSIGAIIQADYFSFLAMPKIGYFGKKAGIYYCPGVSLNPTLEHSNIENHTYFSHLQAAGGEINITPKIIADIKVGYDIGLTGAYFENGIYRKYSGPVLFLGLKLKVSDK
jgi:hypothetical protein